MNYALIIAGGSGNRMGQNIQAIPTSLTKTSALTYNTRVWPFVEYYTCTEKEREALKDKIKYNGMTIMKIGKLTDYTLGVGNFFKGCSIFVYCNRVKVFQCMNGKAHGSKHFFIFSRFPLVIGCYY